MPASPLSTELFRTRDCVVFVKSETLPVSVDTGMITSGWTGGVGVTFAPITQDEILVTRSNGLGGGFMLWGSDESSDQYTSMTESQPYYGYATMGMGAWLIATVSFERYTYASRSGMGPLVPLLYSSSDRLLFSLRGYWTNEDEWSLSGDPRAPNDNVVGFVAQPPVVSPTGIFYLTVQTDL